MSAATALKVADAAVPTPERTMPKNVIEALARVMEEMPAVGRNQRSEQGYNFRGIEDVTAAAQKLMGRYCVVFTPRVLSRKTVNLTINNKPWTQEELEILYTVYGPGGVSDHIEVGPVWGLGRDNSDKGTNKATTQAFKVALIQALTIGEGTHDADHDVAHEADAPTAADPDAPFRELGWKDKAEHDAWRQSITDGAAKLDDNHRRAFKGNWASLGFVWAEPTSKDTAASVDEDLAGWAAPPAETAKETPHCPDCGQPLIDGADCTCNPF